MWGKQLRGEKIMDIGLVVWWGLMDVSCWWSQSAPSAPGAPEPSSTSIPAHLHIPNPPSQTPHLSTSAFVTIFPPLPPPLLSPQTHLQKLPNIMTARLDVLVIISFKRHFSSCHRKCQLEMFTKFTVMFL